jgi:hypothetical protein
MFIHAFIHRKHTTRKAYVVVSIHKMCVSLWVNCTTGIAAFYWIQISWIFHHKKMFQRNQKKYSYQIMWKLGGLVVTYCHRILKSVKPVYKFIKSLVLHISFSQKFHSYHILRVSNFNFSEDSMYIWRTQVGNIALQIQVFLMVKWVKYFVIIATFMNAWMNFLRIFTSCLRRDRLKYQQDSGT